MQGKGRKVNTVLREGSVYRVGFPQLHFFLSLAFDVMKQTQGGHGISLSVRDIFLSSFPGTFLLHFSREAVKARPP